MKRKALLKFVIAFNMLCFGVVYSQERFTDIKFDTTNTYLIKLLNGTDYVGLYLNKDSVNIIIKPKLQGPIAIPLGSVKSIIQLEESELVRRVYWFPNPNPTRYLFSSSAFNLKRGEGYYQNTFGWLSSVSIGISNNISVGGGVEVSSLFSKEGNGLKGTPFFLSSKAGFKVNHNFHISLGALYLKLPNYATGNIEGIGLAVMNATRGNANHHLTGGIGLLYERGYIFEYPFFNVSGFTRVSRNVALLTENWIFTSYHDFTGIYLYGVRFFNEKLSADIAFMKNNRYANSYLIGIPYIDFAIKF